MARKDIVGFCVFAILEQFLSVDVLRIPCHSIADYVSSLYSAMLSFDPTLSITLLHTTS
ncbi:MAG: hypothetical protein ABJB85_05755 [Nitrososphaerota archaeon]